VSKNPANCKLSVLYYETPVKLRRTIQSKRHGMLPYGVVFLHDAVHIYTAVRTGAFQLGVVWPHFLQYWSRSERLLPVYPPEELVWMTTLMQGVKTWLGSQAVVTQTYKTLFPDTSASIPAMTMLRSSLSMYIFFVYNKFSFPLLILLTAHRRLLSS
jgi:hypothetical protein